MRTRVRHRSPGSFSAVCRILVTAAISCDLCNSKQRIAGGLNPRLYTCSKSLLLLLLLLLFLPSCAPPMSPQVMKMDVEGWEYNILQAATRLLSTHHVWYLMAEANRGIIGEDGAYRLLKFLLAFGYRVSLVGFKGPWIQDSDIVRQTVKWEGEILYAVHSSAPTGGGLWHM